MEKPNVPLLFSLVYCAQVSREEVRSQKHTVAVYWFARERLSAPPYQLSSTTADHSVGRSSGKRPFERQSDYRNKIDPSELRAPVQNERIKFIAINIRITILSRELRQVDRHTHTGGGRRDRRDQGNKHSRGKYLQTGSLFIRITCKPCPGGIFVGVAV